MARRYKSVSEAIEHLTDDAEFKQRLEAEIADRAVAKALFAMRCAQGVTQAQMASRLGCSQSRVSKLENASVDRIKVSDLVAYAEALGLRMSISFHAEMTPVEWVKLHAFEIKKHLDTLAALAARDDDILKGVWEFYREALFNILRIFEQSGRKLPVAPEGRAVLEVLQPADANAAAEPMQLET